MRSPSLATRRHSLRLTRRVVVVDSDNVSQPSLGVDESGGTDAKAVVGSGGRRGELFQIVFLAVVSRSIDPDAARYASLDSPRARRSFLVLQ